VAESLVIIGAGVAGLAAGCYARMNGYEATIFEMHDKPGGVCTSWQRKGYVFDGCIHWLVGSKEGSSFNRIWKELGAVQGREMVDHDEFMRVEVEGKKLIVYTDVDRLEMHMSELSTLDSAVIEELAGAIRKLSRLDMPPGKPAGREERMRLLKALPGMLGSLPLLRKLNRVTVGEFAQRFSDPILRQAFSEMFDLPELPLSAVVMTLAWLNAQDAGYPIGGSLEFAKAIERRYLDLGGAVRYGSRVQKIVVEGDRAVGVRLEDGSEHRAGAVISAADGHATLFDMLEGRFVDARTRGFYDNWPLWEPLVQVSFGVDMDLSGEPHTVAFKPGKPVVVAGKPRDSLRYRHFCFDPELAPEGKSVVVVFLPSDYDYWAELARDRQRYNAEKERIATEVLDAMDERFPGFRDRVEVKDVATPMTLERYTGNWRGSYEGWMLTRENSKYMVRPMKSTLPGLDGFYMIGQWLRPGGGLPPAAMSGRDVIRAICKKDSRKFTTTEPA
jgi:phytoene dehydrogenase-like protein